MFRELLPGGGDANASVTYLSLSAEQAPARVVIADAELLLGGHFKKSGADLTITGKDGQKVVITGYFGFDKTPDLVTPQGAGLSGQVVERLALPSAPGQYAQAGAPAGGGIVIGKVERLGGNATVQHANGVVEELKLGDVILQGDVVETRDGSLLAISFKDGTAFNMGANARMVLNELVYEGGGSSNSAVFSLLKGTITFVAGQVAKTGTMRLDTPVATMGIRGTTVNTNLNVDINGNIISVNFSLMPDPDGKTGSFNLIDKTTNTVIATITTTNSTFTLTPSANLGVLSQQLNKTPEQVAQELAIAQVLYPIFLANPENFLNQNPIDPKSGHQHGSSNNPGSTAALNGELLDVTFINNPGQGGGNNAGGAGGSTTIQVHANVGPSIFIDAPINLVEAVTPGDQPGDPGTPTSAVHVTKIDLDGTVTYDALAMQADGWALVAGVWQHAAAYGTLFLDPATDTLTYVLDNALADPLGPPDQPTESFRVSVIDNDGAKASSVVTYTVEGRNDPPQLGADQLAPHDLIESPGVAGNSVVYGEVGQHDFTDPELVQAHTFPAPTNYSGVTWELNGGGSAGTPPAATLAALQTAVTTQILADSTGVGTGSVQWTFSLNNEFLDFLAKDETLTVTYALQILDDYNASTTQIVTVTITGTNDVPEITGSATSAALDETDTTLTANGPLTVTDIDITDTVTMTVGNIVGIDGSSTFAGVNPLTNADLWAMMDVTAGPLAADGPAGSSFTWTFTSGASGDGAFNFLADGETLVLNYTLTATDSSGVAGTDTQVVTISITGTNDAPDITVGVGDADSAAVDETDAPLGATGTLSVADADISNTVTAAVTAVSLGGVTGGLVEADVIGLLAVDSGFVITSTATTGTINWTFDSTPYAFDFLADGEQLTLTYTVTATDSNGVPASDDQVVTITINGKNDAPTITSNAAAASGTFDELPATINSAALDGTSGTITFGDVDLADTHVSPPAQATPTYIWSGGSLTALQEAALTSAATLALTLTDSTGTGFGSVDWDYQIVDSALDFLLGGETLEVTYVITIDDLHIGGTVTESIVITINGNDDPAIFVGTAGADSADAGGGTISGFTGGTVAQLQDAIGDFWYGNGAADTMIASGGDDIFYLANGDFAAGEQINGGLGSDAIVLTNATTVDFSAETVTAIEILAGSNGNDTVTLTATQWANLTSIDLDGGTDTVNVLADGSDISALGFPTVSNVETGNLIGNSGTNTITLTGDQLDAILLSSTIDLGGGSDTINLTSTSARLNSHGATSNADIVGVENISAAAATIGGVTIDLSAQTENFTITGSGFADSITAGSGGDTIVGAANDTLLDGGGGADTLQVGANFTSSGNGQIANIENVTLTAAVTLDLSNQTESFAITGSAGADSITAGGGNDNIFGAVNDTLLDGGGGADTLQVGANFTSSGNGQIANIETVALTTAVTLNVSNQTEGFSIIGSSGADSITAGGGNDTIVGADNDTLFDGSGGVDTLNIGADFTNTGDGQIVNIENITITAPFVDIDLSSQTENLTITAIGGSAEIGSGSGNDIIIGSSSGDLIDAGDGDDTIVGAQNDVLLFGGNGTDTLELGANFLSGNNSQVQTIEIIKLTAAGLLLNLTGHNEGFTIQGSTGVDTIVGSLGNDLIDAGAGADSISGHNGNDIIVGAQNDTLLSGGGNTDTLRIGANFTSTGDAQIDTIENVALTAGVTLDLSNQTEGFAITGSFDPDTITGGSGADSIDAGFGNDVIFGSANDAFFDGGGGIDELRIGANFTSSGDGQIDNIETVTLTAAVTLDLSNQTEGFTITGSSGADSISGGSGDDIIVGAQNDTLFDGNLGTDTLQLGANFTSTGDAQIQDIGIVTLTAAGTTLDLSNQSEGFAITGSSGADTITGALGGDTISGGAGADQLTGGGGADIFKFATGDSAPSGVDTILDFVQGTDIIDVSAIDAVAGSVADDLFIFEPNATPSIDPGLQLGKITWYQTATDTIVQADTDGNLSTAELLITLSGLHTLQQSDFVL